MKRWRWSLESGIAMTDCPACAAAAREPSHYFMAKCRGCTARTVARMPQFREYQRMLEQMHITHLEVLAAATTDKQEHR